MEVDQKQAEQSQINRIEIDMPSNLQQIIDDIKQSNFGQENPQIKVRECIELYFAHLSEELKSHFEKIDQVW